MIIKIRTKTNTITTIRQLATLIWGAVPNIEDSYQRHKKVYRFAGAQDQKWLTASEIVEKMKTVIRMQHGDVEFVYAAD